MADISCTDLLFKGVDIALIPKCQQYTTDLVEAERNRYWAEVYDRFDSQPKIMADHADHSKLKPVSVRVFRSPATGELTYHFPVNAKLNPYNEFIAIGSIAITGEFAVSDAVVEGARQLTTKVIVATENVTAVGALGVWGTFIGALNSSSPEVQRENFQLIREALPQEVGQITVWMSSSKNDTVAKAGTSVQQSVEGTAGNLSPEPSKNDEGLLARLRKRVSNIYEQVWIPRDWDGVHRAFFSGDRYDRMFVNLVLVEMPNGRFQFRLHTSSKLPLLILPGERVLMSAEVQQSDFLAPHSLMLGVFSSGGRSRAPIFVMKGLTPENIAQMLREQTGGEFEVYFAATSVVGSLCRHYTVEQLPFRK